MMPKVIGNDSLIARVNEVQGCMYRQSNELGRLNKAVRRYKVENDKLRELVRKAHACKTNEGCCEDCYQGEGCCPIERDMRELGIEAEE